MKVWIKTVKDGRFSLDVSPAEPVKSVKQKIEQQKGIAPEEARLIFRGELLKDDQLLSHYRLADNDHVILLTNLQPKEPISLPFIPRYTRTLRELPPEQRRPRDEHNHATPMDTAPAHPPAPTATTPPSASPFPAALIPTLAAALQQAAQASSAGPSGPSAPAPAQAPQITVSRAPVPLSPPPITASGLAQQLRASGGNLRAPPPPPPTPSAIDTASAPPRPVLGTSPLFSNMPPPGTSSATLPPHLQNFLRNLAGAFGTSPPAPAPAPTPAAAPTVTLPEVPDDAVRPLVEMGFPHERVKKALLISGMSVERAMEWLLEHAEDADVDVPLTEPQKLLLARTVYATAAAPVTAATGGQQPDMEVQQAIAANVCTFAVTGPNYAAQYWYQCFTCNLVGNEGCCAVCAKTCHKGHKLSNPVFSTRFFCDCGAGVHAFECRAMKAAKRAAGRAAAAAQPPSGNTDGERPR